MDKSKKIMSAVMLAGMLSTAKAPAKTLEPKAELSQAGQRIEIEQKMPSQNMAQINDVQKLKAGLMLVAVMYDENGVRYEVGYNDHKFHVQIPGEEWAPWITEEEAYRKYPQIESQLRDYANEMEMLTRPQKETMLDESLMGPSREC